MVSSLFQEVKTPGIIPDRIFIAGGDQVIFYGEYCRSTGRTAFGAKGRKII